jgi:hypothetical protein
MSHKKQQIKHVAAPTNATQCQPMPTPYCRPLRRVFKAELVLGSRTEEKPVLTSFHLIRSRIDYHYRSFSKRLVGDTERERRAEIAFVSL